MKSKTGIVEFSSKNFTFHAAKNTFVGEAAELENRHLQPFRKGSSTLGLSIKSEKTGNVVDYMMTEIMNEDGEVQGWRYLPTDKSKKKFPECADTKLVVFND